MKHFLIILVLAGLVTAGAFAKSHKKRAASNGASGNFDYYLLALSWAPDFCDTHGTQGNARECGSGNHTGFIVHGLWPQKDGGAPLENCGPSSPVSDAIVTQMLPLMMNAGLIQHEWRSHGSCSGLSAQDYFGTVVRASQSVKIPEEYKNLSRPLTVNAGDVSAKFAQANPGIPRDAFHPECYQGELSDVRICLGKDLKGRSCSVRDCSGSARMLPLR